MAMTAKMRKNRSGAWDFNQFISFSRMQMNRVGPVCGKYPSTSVQIQAVPLRKCKKNEKKSLSGLSSYNKSGAAGTKRPNSPFKKTLKKVKKKLVSALEI